MSNPQSPAEWERLARAELQAAEALAASRIWQQAFYHAGVAVEMALKGRIMRVQRLNQWPDRGPLLIHVLADLVRPAGLEATLSAEVANVTPVGVAWLAAKDWTINIRYDPRPFPPRRGADMVEAVGQKGLLEWLLK